VSGYAFRTDAIALSSPSGRMSKRAREAALARIRQQLFAGVDITGGPTPQPSEAERLRRHADRLDDLANRGMSARKYRREAAAARERAAELEAGL
jgi:hypothetical protein